MTNQESDLEIRAISSASPPNKNYEGKPFSDYFTLTGQTAPSRFNRNDSDASSCLGMYELIR